jgi:hypothetical protein
VKVPQNNEQSHVWLYALALSVTAMLFQGYYFNTGDQAEHLPQVYRLFDPELYHGDFFLALYDQTFTVRAYWVWLVYGFSVVFGVKLSCFMLHLFCLWLISHCWIKIGRYLTGHIAAGILGTFLSLTVFNRFTIGGNTLAGPLFIGSLPAEALASLGVWYYLQQKHNRAFIWLGLATWFQALVGLQWCVILCLTHLKEFNLQHIKQIASCGLLYLVAAAPMLAPIMAKQFIADQEHDQSMYYQLLYINRNFLHYLPSLFPIADYFKLGLLIALSAFLLKTKKAFVLQTCKRWISIIIGGCLLYVLLLEYAQVMAIGKLQWFKTTVWLNMCCSLIIASAIVQSRWFKQNWIESISFKKLTVVFTLACLLFILTSGYFPSEKLNKRYAVWNNPPTDLQLMHTWINNYLPKDALVLVPPDDDAFACEAKRSTPVNFKAVVHEPFYFMAWKKSMETYYNINFSAMPYQSVLPAAKENYSKLMPLPEANKARYRLDDTGNCDFILQLGPRIHQQGKWILTEIR